MKWIEKIITWLSVLVIVFPLLCICSIHGGYSTLMPPSHSHILGTDKLGRDILSLLLVSWHYSVLVGVLAATVGILVAVFLAFASLHPIGKDAIDSLTDVFMSVPRMFVLLLLGMLIPSNTVFVAIIIALLIVFPALRVISSSMATMKHMPFMESARAVGVRGWRLLINYYLRPILPTVVGQWAVSVGWAVYADGGMSFLGVGDVSRPGLGTMLREAVSTPGALYTSMFWWYVFPPLFLLALTTGLLVLSSHLHISR
ncbi:ABC transporter permease subunit [bacterium 3DAC]|jgi:ABC-type dipeptide/oligopeptide/nickel transport system permease subunit|nr:ABC transporter permease [Dictyoglomota bacterium]UZN23427.1 ABC transporter permease subunit [bacterium 3DAC]